MLTPFNKLPPKPEYLSKVKQALNAHSSLSEREIVTATGLTKTQALCAVDSLIKDGTVVRTADKKFSLVHILESAETE